MAVGGLALLFAVLVLNIYHHDNSKPVPDWLRSCMLRRTKVEHAHGKNQIGRSMSDIQVLKNNIIKPDEEMDIHTIISTKNLSEGEKMQLVLLNGILAESRLNRKLMMEMGNSGDLNIQSGEWQELAKKLDKLLFYIFFCITSVINVTILILLSRS